MLFFVPHPPLSSLIAIEKYLEMGQDWRPMSDIQRKFVRGVYAERTDLGFFRERELKTFAGQSASRLNEILKTEGFDIRLQELGPDGIGAVSIMKIVFEWISKATKFPARVDGKSYSFLKFKEGFSVLHSPDHGFPVIKLEAMGGYEVFVTVQGDRRTIPNDGFALHDAIEKIVSSAGKVPDEFDFLKMPSIKVKADIDISWITGLKIAQRGKKGVIIEQAREQVKLEVNEHGVKAEAAAAVGTRSSEYGLTIDESFFIRIKKAGVKKAILDGFIDRDGWVEIPPR